MIDIWFVSVSGCYKECYHEHLCASTHVDTNFHLSWSKLLSQIVTHDNFFCGTARLFSKVSAPFTFLTALHKVHNFFTSLNQPLVIVQLLIVAAILVSVK